ncbi:MAG: DUF222 domain-containing protein, partial [Nostocoides sp.]
MGMDVGDAAVVMDRLAVSESGGLSGVGDELWERAVVLAGRLNVVYAELVAVTAQVIAAQAWGGQGGVRSPEHWLALRAGLAPGTAAQVVAVARARTRLPVVSGLFASGVLSLDQAAAVVTRVPVAYDAAVGELAPLLTVTQLRRVLSRYPFDRDPASGADADPASDPASGADAGPD